MNLLKLYLKHKLASMIKDKLIGYSSEMEQCRQNEKEWMCKIYDPRCSTKAQFEKQQEMQISWCNEQYRAARNKREAVIEILHIVESL